MLFTPLRKALIAGAGIFAVGVGAGVTIHSATAGAATLTGTTVTPSPAASPKSSTECHPPGKGLGPAEQVLGIAAGVLGQTQQQVLDQLRAGKTLDQIAGSKASTIEQMALDKLKAALDKAVSNGKLSSTQESTMLDRAKTTLEKAMSSDLSGKVPAAGAECTPPGLLGMLVKVTAEKTGMTVQQVMDALKAGKSIDQIAGSKAGDVRAAVLQMEQQKLGAELDNLMGRSGLTAPGGGHKGGPLFGGGMRGHGPKGSPPPSPSATPSA